MKFIWRVNRNRGELCCIRHFRIAHVRMEYLRNMRNESQSSINGEWKFVTHLILSTFEEKFYAVFRTSLHSESFCFRGDRMNPHNLSFFSLIEIRLSDVIPIHLNCKYMRRRNIQFYLVCECARTHTQAHTRWLAFSISFTVAISFYLSLSPSRTTLSPQGSDAHTHTYIK